MLGFSQRLAAGRSVRAGESVTLLELPPSPGVAALWERLDRERLHVKFRACSCSAFDECWTSTLVGTRATRVESCPVPKVPKVPKVPFAIPGAEGLER